MNKKFPLVCSFIVFGSWIPLKAEMPIEKEIPPSCLTSYKYYSELLLNKVKQDPTYKIQLGTQKKIKDQFKLEAPQLGLQQEIQSIKKSAASTVFKIKTKLDPIWLLAVVEQKTATSKIHSNLKLKYNFEKPSRFVTEEVQTFEVKNGRCEVVQTSVVAADFNPKDQRQKNHKEIILFDKNWCLPKNSKPSSNQTADIICPAYKETYQENSSLSADSPEINYISTLQLARLENKENHILDELENFGSTNNSNKPSKTKTPSSQ